MARIARAAARRPPARPAARCALITALGSPTEARSLRIALLAKIWAPTSRCAARPVRTAGSGRCGARGSASADAPTTASSRDNACANGNTPRRRLPHPQAGPRPAAPAPSRPETAGARLRGRRENERRWRQRVRRGVCLTGGRELFPREQLGKARKVDRLGGDERVGQRNCPAAAQCAMLLENRGERASIIQHARMRDVRRRALDAGHDDDRQREQRQREACVSRGRTGRPRRIELPPQMPRHRDRRRTGEQGGQRRTGGAKPPCQKALNLVVERIGALTRPGRQ